MIDGTGPRMKRPAGGPNGMKGGTVAESGRDSIPKLLARAEWVELCLPSDLWEEERSVMAWLPNALPVLIGRKSADERDPAPN